MKATLGLLALLMLPSPVMAMNTRQATERIFRLEPEFLGADYELGWATDLELQHDTYAPDTDLHAYSWQARRLTYTVFAARCKRKPVRGTAQLRLVCPVGTVQIDGTGRVVTFQPEGSSPSAATRTTPRKGGSGRDVMALMRTAQRNAFAKAIGKDGDVLWTPGTFSSGRASLRYHFKKHVSRHGYRVTEKQYTYGNNLYQGVTGRRGIFRNCVTENWPIMVRLFPSGEYVTRTGTRIQCPKTLMNRPDNPANGWGGIFDNQGQIVTFWLTKGRYP